MPIGVYGLDVQFYCKILAFGVWWSDRGGGRAALVAKMSGFAGVRFRDHRFLQIMVAE